MKISIDYAMATDSYQVTLPEPVNLMRCKLLEEDTRLAGEFIDLKKQALWRLKSTGVGASVTGPVAFVGLMHWGQPWLFTVLNPKSDDIEVIAVPLEGDMIRKVWTGQVASGDFIAQGSAGLRIVFRGDEASVAIVDDLPGLKLPASCPMANLLGSIPFSMKEIGDREKVLYWYDGPLVFLATDDFGQDHIFYCHSDPNHDIWGYVGSPLKAGDLQALEAGTMSLFEPFDRAAMLWEAVWPGEGDKYLGWTVPSTGCPFLPPAGFTLYPNRIEPQQPESSVAPHA